MFIIKFLNPHEHPTQPAFFGEVRLSWTPKPSLREVVAGCDDETWSEMTNFDGWSGRIPIFRRTYIVSMYMCTYIYITIYVCIYIYICIDVYIHGIL